MLIMCLCAGNAVKPLKEDVKLLLDEIWAAHSHLDALLAEAVALEHVPYVRMLSERLAVQGHIREVERLFDMIDSNAAMAGEHRLSQVVVLNDFRDDADENLNDDSGQLD